MPDTLPVGLDIETSKSPNDVTVYRRGRHRNKLSGCPALNAS